MIAGTAVDNNGAPIPALDFFAVNPIGTGPGQVTQSQFNTLFGDEHSRLEFIPARLRCQVDWLPV